MGCPTEGKDQLEEDLEGYMGKKCQAFMGVIDISSYRAQLYDYLKARMMAIAPNLTVLVGDLVGARLISHAVVVDLVCCCGVPEDRLQLQGIASQLVPLYALL
uniref:(California timema) hypothetical protein n=1 Tax=Timema californicum TaxID=61474 RepID=A0A7R9J6N4_TIMCA|nr:unnamed protein product [Timema californicum]